MSMSNKQWLFLQDVAKLIVEADRLSIKLTGGELYRTKEQQEIYLEKGLSKTMNSQHLNRLAIDFNFFTSEGKLTYDKDFVQPLGDYWESLRPENKWGGNFETFQDTPHFQSK